MHKRFIQQWQTLSAALACLAALCQWSMAANPANSSDAQMHSATPPASGRRMIITQILPAVQETPAHENAVPTTGVVQAQAVAPFPATTPIQSPAVIPPGTPGQNAPGLNPINPVGQLPPAVLVPVPVLPPQDNTPPLNTPTDEVPLPPAPENVPMQMAPTRANTSSPFLEDSNEESSDWASQDGELDERRGVQPYGGGHPTDWPWGCNGSPYRTGPGLCDDWRVGCRWHVTLDGIVMDRDPTNLGALQTEMIESDLSGIEGFPTYEQFDFDPGARITFTSQVARYMDWDVQVVYEGIPEWHASIVYPILPLDPQLPLPPPGTPPTDPDFLTPIERGTEQRSLHYTSTFNSAELNFLRGKNPAWRPVFGIRYIKFDDEINDFVNQEAPPPLPGPFGSADPGSPGDPDAVPPVPPTPPTPAPAGTIVTMTDRLNLYDIQNNLIGFQIGLLHDTWQVNRRFAIEGYINGGVYHNRIKYTNLKSTFTTQFFADNVDTTTFDETRTDFSDTTINDVREYSQIAYVGEASLTGVTRLNKCWALRCGYQALYIANVHLADDAYLGNENTNRDLFFHGWHAGIECRR